MTALKDRFWAKVAFKEFIRHFRKLSPEQIVSDVMASMDALEDLDDEGDSFGSKMVRWSMERVEQYPMAQANGQKGGRPRKSITADGDIREDYQARPDGSSITRNETRAHDALERSATIYGPRQAKNGDDGHREAPDESANVSGQFRGSAKNQGESNTGSTVPAVCPESGKDYDQETDQVSTDEARESQALESRRTDGHSLRVGNVARPPVRSSGRNSRCPNSREEFHAFVADNNLHEGLAEEWYAIHEARGWVDENGNPIKNWRGALKNFCIKIEQKRRTA